MSLTDLTKPSVPAVALATLKEHLRIETTDEDTLLLPLLEAATRHVERKADTKLIQRQVRYSTSYKQHVVLPIAPLVSVDALEVRSSDGSLSSVSLDNVVVDTDTGSIDLTHVNTGILDAQQLRFTCTIGHGQQADDMPEELAQAVLLQAAHMYEARGIAEATRTPLAVTELCNAHKRPQLV